MVATVTPINDAKSKAGYFFTEGYYAKDSAEHRNASSWFGKAAALLKLGRTVAPTVFERVLNGDLRKLVRQPGIGKRLGRFRNKKFEHRPGVEITLSAPKSVSIEGLVFGNKGVIKAHDKAVRKTLAFVERELLVTRVYNRETKRMDRVPAGGMVAACFRHLASRSGDPQLHTHALVANATLGPDGTWRSLDMGRLHAQKHLIGAYYRNELAKGLLERGFELAPSMIGHVPGFEIRGYTRESIEDFSSRRKDILAYLRENDLPYTTENAQKATLETRPPKVEKSQSELRSGWLALAQRTGLVQQGPRARRRANGRDAEKPVAPPALDIVFRAAAHLEERASVFAAHELRSRALAHSPGIHSIEDIDAAIAQLVDGGHLIRPPRGRIEDAFVTDRARRSEQEVIARMRDGMDAARPLAGKADVEAALAAGGLTDGQRKAVRTLLLDPHRTVGVQGSAGTGKTTMLRQVIALCGERRVVGLAPSASAAHTLEREAGLPTHTLQWFLARYRDVADGVIDPEALDALKAEYAGALVIVDEMSMVSTAQALALLRIADRLEIGRLALVGDRRQLRAVSAGQPFRQLQEAGLPTAQMDEIMRQRNPTLKAAVADAVAGQPARAIEALGSDVVEVPVEELGAAAGRIWLALAPEDRERTALFAPTHAILDQITETVREGLRDEHILSGKPLALTRLADLRMTTAQRADGRNVREGDFAVFYRNLDDLDGRRIAPGDHCIVAAIEAEADSFVVHLEHPDGTSRRIRPSDSSAPPTTKPVGERFQLYETAEIEVQVGDRIRWTRNDRRRDLLNGHRARIVAIEHGPDLQRSSVTIETDDKRRLRLAGTDPQLKHIRFAYASTVHAAQGATHDSVIGVLDSGHPALTDQCMFYTGISRARDTAIVLTDDREHLAETLEENPGERLTALDALGEFPDDGLNHDLEAGRERVQARGRTPRSALAKTAPLEPRVRRWAADFRDWQRRRDRHADEADRLGVHPARHPGHAPLLDGLWQLVREAALTDVAERLAGLAGRLARDLVARAKPPAATGTGDEAAPPRVLHWRSTLETLVGDSAWPLDPDDAYWASLPAASRQLLGAVGNAQRLLKAHDWVRAWDDERGADRGRVAEAIAAAVAAAEAMCADPALPDAARDAVAARLAAHRAGVAEAAWQRDRARLEADARAEGRPIHARPETGELVAAAWRLEADAALPSDGRAAARRWAAETGPIWLEHAADAELRALESLDARGQSAVDETLDALNRPAYPTANAPDRPGDRLSGNDERGNAVRAAVERTRVALTVLAGHAAPVLADPDLDAPVRERLGERMRRVEAGRAAAEVFLAWARRWQAHVERCLGQGDHLFDGAAAEDLVAEAEALFGAGGLGAVPLAYIDGLSATYRAYTTERARFGKLLGQWERLLNDASEPEKTVYPLPEWKGLMASLNETLSDASALTDDERGAVEWIVQDYAQYLDKARDEGGIKRRKFTPRP